MLGFGKKKDASEAQASAPEVEVNGPPEFSDEDMAKARKWFQQAKAVADTRNYDYAIECYIGGLKCWPEAVEEGHEKLVGVAMARLNAGGKKPGVKDTLKLSMSARDPKQAMLNAETLFAKDPLNYVYLGGVFRGALRGGYDETAFFFGPKYWDALLREKKVKDSLFMECKELWERLGDRCEERGHHQRAVDAYELSVKSLERLRMLRPDNLDLVNVLQYITSKLTITKGHYKDGDFRESVRDKDQQQDRRDQDRRVQSTDRLAELVEHARQEMEANPGVAGKVMTLVDLLTRREEDEPENEAIAILQEHYEQEKEYRFKQRADDIRMRQMGRHIRNLQKQGDQEAALKAEKKRLKYEIEVFSERAKQYPTDLRIKFQLGTRLMRGRLFDQAIPILQEARADPKSRLRCNILIGRCFCEKSLFQQAINMFERAVGDVVVPGDEASKELYYWMGRAYQAEKRSDDAKRAFGQVLEWDYNYRDVRDRMEALEA